MSETTAHPPRDPDNDEASETTPSSGAAVRRTMLETKLRSPFQRDGLVPRTALLGRLRSAGQAKIVAVVAPAGYGKTTLLAQWSELQQRDVAWVSVDAGDNDPATLLGALAVAISRVQPIDREVVDALGRRSVTIHNALLTLMSAFDATTSLVLVLDNLEAVDNPESCDLIVELALRLPAGSQLAYASRSPLPLPNALLRSQGALVEVVLDDLAMDRPESEQLLAQSGFDLSPREIDEVVAATEGWPAGIYLAGLASREPRNTVVADFVFRGDDVLMADYIRSEILDSLPAATVSFLTRTSVLERLSGPLCDTVLEAGGSQAALEALESANLLVVPLDRRRSWYRYHRLFRDLLAAELARREPELVADLHGRAARWYEQHGIVEEAIVHAQQSDDPDLVAELVAPAVVPTYGSGRAMTARAWLAWFRDEGLIDRYPAVAVTGAFVEALSGHPAAADQLAAAAEAGPVEGTEMEGSVAWLRAMLSRHGTAQMRADARRAQELLPPANGLLASAMAAEAMSHLLDDEPERADPILARAFDKAEHLEGKSVAAFATAERALIAVGRGDWDRAGSLSERALTIVETEHLQDHLESTSTYVAAARVAMHRGDLQQARQHVAGATRLRPLLTYAVPWTAHFQLALAETHLELADPAGARAVLREVRDILRQRPNLSVVARAADTLEAKLDAFRHESIGASSLTTAELRLLPYLATHLSFREIGERLYVSRHTVKSQAISVYRRLGVSSRSEAIERVQELGLLGH